MTRKICHITLNGTARTVDAGTLSTLVETLDLNPKQIAIELGGTIIPRSAYGNTELTDGAVIELVAFVGGG